MLARRRELLGWGTNIYFSSMFFFSTCATDFAEKEELLVVLYCYRRWHQIKSCSLALKCSYRFEEFKLSKFKYKRTPTIFQEEFLIKTWTDR